MLRSGSCVLALLAFAACGGSGGGGGGADTAPPIITILFPPPVSVTDAGMIVVRGTGTDGSGISALTVNGVAATSTDMFANWQATVPLVAGANAITVDATDGPGNNDPAAATATVTMNATATTTGMVGAGPPISMPRDILIDQARNRLLYIDTGNDSLSAVDLATGNRTVVSMGATGGGMPANMVNPVGMAGNLAGSIVFVTDDSLDLVIGINILSGIRQVISNNAMGGAPNFADPRGIAFDSNRIYWLDFILEHMISALVTMGNARTLESSNTAPVGLPNFTFLDRVKIEPGANRAFTTERTFAGAIYSVNLTTGARTTIADTGMGTGGPAGFDTPVGLEMDLGNNRLMTQLEGSNATVFVDIATGNRTTVSQSPGMGNGPAFMSEEGLAYDNVNQLAYVIDDGVNAVYMVDAVTGERVIMSR